jgi:hypothetical protein
MAVKNRYCTSLAACLLLLQYREAYVRSEPYDCVPFWSVRCRWQMAHRIWGWFALLCLVDLEDW